MNNSSLYLNNKFLNYTQALESFHRLLFDGNYVKNENEFNELIFKPLMEAIPSITTKDHKNAIIARLKYANEYSQRKRLRELLSRSEPVMTLFIHDFNEFIEQIVSTRNHFTHFNKNSLNSNILKKSDLLYATHRLRILLETCLLQEIGLPIERIEKIYRRNDRLCYLRVPDTTKLISDDVIRE
ncbi:MAG: HEPN domain-containing protein [Bacteroidota bacterium]